MNISTKTKIFSLTLLSLSLSGMVLANTSIRETIIKPDLSNAVQSIQKIIFSTGGISGSPSAIPVSNQQGVIHLEGKLFATTPENQNTKAEASALLIGGSQNKNLAKDATIIVGTGNTIEGEKSTILGGKSNTIMQSAKQGVILGGVRQKITDGTNNLTIGGNTTNIGGSKNIALGTSESRILGSQNIIAGSNIKIENPNLSHTFVWSDNKKRDDNKKVLTPKTSNTLYLRSENGVMINTSTPRATLTVDKKLTQIADEPGNCSPEKIGQLIFRNGCFYACSDGSTWDNLAGTPECGGANITTKTFPIPQTAKQLPQGPTHP